MIWWRGSLVKEIEYIPMEPKEPEVIMETNKEKLFKEIINYLDTDVSEKILGKDTVKDSLACAETASLILGKVIKGFPIIYNTVSLSKYLKSDPLFKGTLNQDIANIWIALSKMDSKGNITVHGHVAFQYRPDRLASNDSSNGKFWGNYTPEQFTKYFTSKGLKIEMFELKD